MLHRPGARGKGHPLLKLESPRLIPLNTEAHKTGQGSSCGLFTFTRSFNQRTSEAGLEDLAKIELGRARSAGA